MKKFVYKCIENENKLSQFGLSIKRKYKIGYYITYSGNPNKNLQNAYTTIAVNSDNGFTDYPFSGWNLNNLTEARLATFFAIVVGTSAMAASDALDFQSISLIPGNLPCRPGPRRPPCGAALPPRRTRAANPPRRYGGPGHRG